MEIDSLLLAAMKAYEKQDYSMAETLFNQLLSANDNPEIRFYLAIAQLETAKTNEALNNLQLLYAQPETYRYYEPTRWYLALAHLKLHQKDEAGKYLEELVKLEGEYWDKAKELLARIK
jgi:thioredoxin-like negative regulator of GroEL